MRGWGKSFAKQFLLFSAIFLFIGLIVFFLSPAFLPRPSWSWSLSEEPLAKNAYLNISPGERFVYLLTADGQSRAIVLEAMSSPNCPGVVLVDVSAREAVIGQNSIRPGSSSSPSAIDSSFYSVCLDQNGVERSAAGRLLGTNISFSNLSWPYFQPWMLALSDNFNWSANATLTIQPFNITQLTSYNYEVSGRPMILGRDAFEVHVYSRTLSSGSSLPPLPSQQMNGELPLRLFVDSQKRVLLKAEFSDSNLTLVEAPFLPLNATN